MKTLKMITLGLCSTMLLHSSAKVPQFRLIGTRLEAKAAVAGAKLNSQLMADNLPADVASRKIKVALLLDTSNSMDGLIDQAKAQLWSIVNELSSAKAGILSPDLQIALYHYGNSGLEAEKGFIQQVTPFTTNLDLISEKLFALHTNGGDEFCGQAIYTSLKDLDWGKENADYKTIFIAGNEPFTQGSIAPGIAFNLAKQQHVFVNAIYCGNQQTGISDGWNAPLTAAIGAFMNIDSDQQTAYIATPYDQQISDLNAKLNSTYVWYGSEGQQAYANMNVQDMNAAHYGQANSVDRAMMKSGRLYNARNDSWDLVDKITNDPGFDVGTISAANLPEEMRNMSKTEQKAYILQKQSQRAAITQQISNLGVARTQFIAKEKGKTSGDNSLQDAILTAIHDQASTKGFTFPALAGNVEDVPEPAFVPALVDFDYFMDLAAEVKEYRKNRLVDFGTFLAMSKEPNTVILDARSTEHFTAVHLKGAIHLDYSMFNLYDLARLIPDQNTRILIYCNNNFDTQSPTAFENVAKPEVRRDIERTLVSKAGPIPIPGPIKLGDSKTSMTKLSVNANEKVLAMAPDSYSGIEMDPKKTLALNIHTFINLYGYGYKNVYELSQLVSPSDPRLELEGSSITEGWRVKP